MDRQFVEKPKNAKLDITIYCQACGAKLAFSAKVVGKKARCLSCGHIFRVPGIQPTDATPKTSRSPTKKAAAKRAAPAPSSGLKSEMTDSTVFALPFTDLADAEKNAPSQAASPLEQLAAEDKGAGRVIADQVESAQATATALSVMQGLFYLAVIGVTVFLLVHFFGVVLAAWGVLPIIVVHGRRIGTRTIFLATGGSMCAPKPTAPA